MHAIDMTAEGLVLPPHVASLFITVKAVGGTIRTSYISHMITHTYIHLFFSCDLTIQCVSYVSYVCVCKYVCVSKYDTTFTAIWVQV